MNMAGEEKFAPEFAEGFRPCDKKRPLKPVRPSEEAGKGNERSDNTEIALPSRSAALLLRERDGKLALLYIYLAANNFLPAGAASALKLSPEEINELCAKLTALGFVVRPIAKHTDSALPDYSRTEMARFIDEDIGFNVVYKYTQELYGRLLSEADLTVLLRIYNYLAFTPDAIMTLFSYCAGEYRRTGKGLPSFKQVEREALKWERDGVTTGAQADEYLVNLRAKNETMEKIVSLLGLAGRPTPTQMKYIDEWTSAGFTPDEIYEAYDITVIRTGGLKWEYLNRVLQNKPASAAGIAAGEASRQGRASKEPQTDFQTRGKTKNSCRFGEEELAAVKRARDYNTTRGNSGTKGGGL